MAMQLGEAFVILRGDDTRLKSDLKKAEHDTKIVVANMERSAKRLGTAIGSFARGMTLYVTAPIVAQLGYAVKAAADAEDTQVSLATALAGTGDATERTMLSLTAYAEKLQETTKYEANETLNAMALGKSLGLKTAVLQDATKAAMGLATRYRIDLSQAMKIVAGAAQGNVSALKYYAAAMTNTGDTASKFGQFIRLGLRDFRLAEAMARTTGGQFTQFKNAVLSLARSVGNTLLPVLSAFVAVAKPIAQFVQGLPAPIKAFGVVLTMAVGAIGPLVAGLAALANAYLMLASAEVKAAIGAAVVWAKGHPAAAMAIAGGIIAAVGTVTTALALNMKTSEKDLKGMLSNIKAAIKEFDNQTLPGLPGLDEDAQKGMTDAALAAKKILDEENNAYREQAQQIWDIYTGLKASREEEEKRQRAAIGWTGLADLWRGAAVAGAQARFAEVYKPERMGHPDTRNELQIEARLMQRAVKDWQATQENTKATKNAMEMLVDLVRRIAPAFEAQVI